MGQGLQASQVAQGNYLGMSVMPGVQSTQDQGTGFAYSGATRTGVQQNPQSTK